MTKYHLNPKTNRINKCGAQDGNCPFGTNTIHVEATNVVEAKALYEKAHKKSLQTNKYLGKTKDRSSIENKETVKRAMMKKALLTSRPRNTPKEYLENDLKIIRKNGIPTNNNISYNEEVTAYLSISYNASKKLKSLNVKYNYLSGVNSVEILNNLVNNEPDIASSLDKINSHLESVVQDTKRNTKYGTKEYQMLDNLVQTMENDKYGVRAVRDTPYLQHSVRKSIQDILELNKSIKNYHNPLYEGSKEANEIVKKVIPILVNNLDNKKNPVKDLHKVRDELIDLGVNNGDWADEDGYYEFEKIASKFRKMDSI